MDRFSRPLVTILRNRISLDSATQGTNSNTGIPFSIHACEILFLTPTPPDPQQSLPYPYTL